MGPAGRSESKSLHKLALAGQLLENIELSNLRPEQLLLKASRLARLVENDEVSSWLRFELVGYPRDHPVAVSYLTRTGRWINREEGEAYRDSWVGIDALIASKEQELERLPPRLPSLAVGPSSEESEFSSFERFHLTSELGRLRRIRSLILFCLHHFAASTYYELAFSGLAESIFESHRKEIDALLARTAGDALEKIPAIVQRLSEGDKEAISQAMATGRRVLATFADSIQPPQQSPLSLDGKPAEATGEKYLNRLHYFIVNNCSSDARKARLRNAIVDLNARFAAGVHADVSPDEARALFVLLYVNLGEILSLNLG